METGQYMTESWPDCYSKFSLLCAKMDSAEVAIFVILLCFIKLLDPADEGITIL
jgi:hypothetical protein